jgi:restriction endonuclease S subunit
MLISSGHIFNGLEYGDSIKQLISNEVDIVIANPPFGIKTLKYEKIDSHLKREYVPIETSNAVSLFLQIIIYILKINGRCAIVIPKGKDLFGETNDLIAIRKYLMKTCDLKEIIYLPSGLFINTDIETCIFYFVKKIKGSDVLTVKENRKNEKTYEFTDDYQTDKVIFYNYNIDTEEKEFLVEAPIEKIIQKNYSLNYINYLAEINNNNDDNVIIKTLGEISNIISGKRIEDKLEPGHYPIYGGGGLTLHYTNQFNREGKTCKISRDGISLHNCVMILNEKYYLSNHGSTISSKSDLLLNEYLWYYLLLHKEMVYECSQGMAQRGISIDRLNKLKIPIISIDKQKDIIKYLNFIYETCIKSSLSKIEELKQENQYYIKNQQNYGKNKINPLGEICEFLPKSQKPASYGKDSGLYPFYTSSQNCSKFCDEADYHEDALIIGTGGNPNIKFSNQFSCSTDNFIITINENIDIKFVYYYLLNNIQLLEKGFIGVTIKHLSKEFLCNIKICIPPIGRQKEIVEYCYFNDTLIKGLNKEIKKNKKASEQYMDDMLKGLIIKED